MLTGLWPSPSGSSEYALSFDRQREKRVLVIPALFEEGNKLRHFTVELMRRLDAGDIDCFLPDLPGTNESLEDLERQSLDSWRAAIDAAAHHFGATHVLTMRGGALVAPAHLSAMHYAPVAGSGLLRAMLRAQVMIASEQGRTETRDGLLASGLAEGLRLGGYDIGPQMIGELEAAKPAQDAEQIAQGDVGGGGLWLRAEPGHDPAQAQRLADIIMERLR
ncbi:hypothetical protein [Aurantiacibacter rhizosphaerae]|uniref:Hydrolase 2, exosortase A system-associated n=1 Tax=Aurantiacibacter rhizosphaerae TaxID=2691582 RepID=A0A844XBK4_9SPHN|nr:hypothetical protein [Aurantiacibacter rhizosphaerae]MWV27861.1 hypothetical protein [Aurantiacibacter rhizosphaerae]